MDALTGPVARILFGLPFVIFGVRHFLAGPDMAGMLPGWLPGGVLWIYLTGLALLLAGIAILTKIQGKLACLLLALLLLAFTLSLHLPAAIEGGPMEHTMFLLHVVLVGAALGFAGILGREENGGRPAGATGHGPGV